jgi:hypothetical protein
MTNQPTPTGFEDLDRVMEEVPNPEKSKTLADAEASLTGLDDLRRKLCQRPPAPQKSKWRFW